MEIENLKDIKKLNDLTFLNNEELLLLRNTITEIMKNRKSIKQTQIKSQLSEGMKVKVDHKKLDGVDCTVVKVNRKKVIINCSKGRFTVPMTMLILD